MRTHNKGFASGGVMRKLGALCFYKSSVLYYLEIYGKKP